MYVVVYKTFRGSSFFQSLEPSVSDFGTIVSNPRIRCLQSPDTMVSIPGYKGSEVRI